MAKAYLWTHQTHPSWGLGNDQWHLGRVQTDLKLALHGPFLTSLCNPLSLNLSRTWDLLLTKGMWQRWWNTTPVMISHYGRFHLASIFSLETSLMAWWGKKPCCTAPVARNCRHTLGAESSPPANSQEPARSWDPLSSNHKEMSSANSPRESGSRCFLSQSANENITWPTFWLWSCETLSRGPS